jgi:hypothetical protein
MTRLFVRWPLLLACCLSSLGCSADAGTLPSASAGSAGTPPAAAGGGAAGQSVGGGSGAGGVSTSGSASGGLPSGGSATGGTGGQSDGGSAGLGAGSGGGNAGAGQGGSAGPPMHKELILYDDDGKLWYVNNEEPDKGWDVESGTGRDLQLVGGGLVMLGKSNGWSEFRLSDGMMVGGRTGFSGVQAVHRLADGRTMLATVASGNIVLQMVTAAGMVDQSITYQGYTYVRLVRPTATGTFLVTNDDLVFEGDASGKVLNTWPIAGNQRHVWKAMRLANGNTVIATGYNATLEVYGPDKAVLLTIGKAEALKPLDPHFFADFHVMSNGDYFVVNSQADSSNASSVQLLQFNPAGELVWQQKQPAGVRSVEAAIVLDGVDTSKLQVEPQGVLVPAP